MSIRTILPVRLISTLALIAILSPMLLAQTLPPGVWQGPSMAGITEYTYPNGLRVAIAATVTTAIKTSR